MGLRRRPQSAAFFKSLLGTRPRRHAARPHVGGARIRHCVGKRGGTFAGSVPAEGEHSAPGESPAEDALRITDAEASVEGHSRLAQIYGFACVITIVVRPATRVGGTRIRY